MHKSQCLYIWATRSSWMFSALVSLVCVLLWSDPILCVDFLVAFCSPLLLDDTQLVRRWPTTPVFQKCSNPFCLSSSSFQTFVKSTTRDHHLSNFACVHVYPLPSCFFWLCPFFSTPSPSFSIPLSHFILPILFRSFCTCLCACAVDCKWLSRNGALLLLFSNLSFIQFSFSTHKSTRKRATHTRVGRLFSLFYMRLLVLIRIQEIIVSKSFKCFRRKRQGREGGRGRVEEEKTRKKKEKLSIKLRATVNVKFTVDLII